MKIKLIGQPFDVSETKKKKQETDDLVPLNAGRFFLLMHLRVAQIRSD